MASVAFLRAVNVGGNVVRTAELARSLSPVKAVNLGAAGTFVFPGPESPGMIRSAIEKRLPFPTEIIVVPADGVTALLNDSTFGRDRPLPGTKRFVTALASRPKALPDFPVDRPVGSSWEIRLVGVEAPFALSLYQPQGPRRTLYSNEVVERELSVRGTTRGWETIERVGSVLREL